VLLAASISGVVVACGGSGQGPEVFTGIAPDDPGPIHVHGLGVDPEDGALFIATHTGLYRVEEGESKAERVGDKYQDTMGFTIAGPDLFLGSGHPDARDLQNGSPPLLGLIRSKDAGRTWTPVSLSGKADFHVLRYLGNQVYGYDATNDRLMVSEDAGKSWSEHQPPAPLLDLAADPENPDHIAATTAGELPGTQGLQESADGGATWTKLGDAVGLLVWPAAQRLYLVDPRGFVSVSADRGKSFNIVGDIGGQPAAFMAIDSRELYVALHDGKIKVSRDAGETWSLRSTASTS
jgi:ligand-binding sensor domain-containing protein